MKRIGSGSSRALEYFPSKNAEDADSFFSKVYKTSFQNLSFTEADYYHLLNNSNINNDDLFLIKEQVEFNFNHIDRILGESFARKNMNLGRKQAINQKISEGYSLKIFDIDQYHFLLEKLTRDFRILLEARTTLNSYYTPADNRCFNPHRDDYPLIVFQIFGQKEWVIEKTNSSDMGNATLDNVECESFILHAGEAIILPANHLHQCRTLDQDSLHITLGIHQINMAKFISDLITYESQHEPFLPPKKKSFSKDNETYDSKNLFFDENGRYKFEINFLQFHYASYLNRHLFTRPNYSSSNIDFDGLNNSHDWFYYDEDHKVILTKGSEIMSTLPKELTLKILALENFNLKLVIESLDSAYQASALKIIYALIKVGYFI